MEQGIRDFDTLLLRFKFHAFYDLNPKAGSISPSYIHHHNGNGTLSNGHFSSNGGGAQNDHVRINLIYEQAKWQILNEEIDCTEEEMLLFASLQLQVGLQANVPQPQEDAEDDVESALNELQISLDGGYSSHRAEDLTNIPQLTGFMKYLKPRRFTLKGYKTSFFVCRDLQLSSWKNSDHFHDYSQTPTFSINLKGCEVLP